MDQPEYLEPAANKHQQYRDDHRIDIASGGEIIACYIQIRPTAGLCQQHSWQSDQTQTDDYLPGQAPSGTEDAQQRAP